MFFLNQIKRNSNLPTNISELFDHFWSSLRMRFLSSAQHLFSLRLTKASAWTSAGRPFELVSWLSNSGLSVFGSHSSLVGLRLDEEGSDEVVEQTVELVAVWLVAELTGVKLLLIVLIEPLVETPIEPLIESLIESLIEQVAGRSHELFTMVDWRSWLSGEESFKVETVKLE